jgi:hypothetical protein
MPDIASLLPQSAVEGVMTIPVAPGTGENHYAESHNCFPKKINMAALSAAEYDTN